MKSGFFCTGCPSFRYDGIANDWRDGNGDHIGLPLSGYALRRRLAEFGLVPGTKVRCRYRSPDGGVTAIGLRGAVLALRTGDLRRITVGIG